MNKLCAKFCFVLLLGSLITSTVRGQDEFDRIESRVVTYLKTKADTSYNLTLKPDGSWADIDYLSTVETSWPPLLHLHRIRQFALQDTVPTIKVLKALRYWLQVNPKSNNWFQNDIAVPTTIGEILLLLKNNKIVPIALRDSLVNQMQQVEIAHAIGANKLDIAIHMIYRACIVRDKAVMDFAVQQAFMPISLDNKEGLQPDFSYLQHGPQLQIASYGQVFLFGEYKVASWLIGTSYAIPAEKLKILDHYLIHTYLKTIRGRYIDFNTEGRGISRNDVLDKLSIINLLEFAKQVNPSNTEVLTAAEQRIQQIKPPSYEVEPTHSYFYKSDYTLHNRSTYSFNVRTVSKRTIRAETGNRENLKGKFLVDGSTNIQRTGEEYFNIMPIWEWDKIPGITSRDYIIDPKTTLEWGERGVGAFIGGTTDGMYGTTVYDLNYNEVSAKKAWFFFDEEIVCLGTNINSFAKEPIITSVNQTWQKGRVSAFGDGKLFDARTGFTNKNVQWVWHDSVGYHFPNDGLVNLTNDKQTGSWATINANRSKAEVTGKVFKLWLNHGVDPVNQSYAYVVVPGISESEMIGRKASGINIVMNTSLLQAVVHTGLKMIQAVFYEAGNLNYQGCTLSVNQPCVVLVKAMDGKNPTVYISDPTQTLTDVNIRFNGASASLTFPQGAHKGATTSFEFNKPHE